MSDAPGGRDPGYVIRPVTPDDMEVLVNLVRELLVYERLEAHAKSTPDDFRRALFGPRPSAEAVLVDLDGEAVGFALWFTTFSTSRGQPCLYLEDLFVRPEYRGRGIGKALLAMLARLVTERGCGKLEWSVLNWNEPAIGFYRSLWARPMDEWTVYRLDGEPLRQLAARSPDLKWPHSTERIPNG